LRRSLKRRWEKKRRGYQPYPKADGSFGRSTECYGGTNHCLIGSLSPSCGSNSVDFRREPHFHVYLVPFPYPARTEPGISLSRCSAIARAEAITSPQSV